MIFDIIFMVGFAAGGIALEILHTYVDHPLAGIGITCAIYLLGRIVIKIKYKI